VRLCGPQILRFLVTAIRLSAKSEAVKRQRIVQEREDRIEMEIVVDACDESERAMGWYYYLDEAIQFPFKARCIGKQASSPLKVGQEVEVLGLADTEECAHEIKVTIQWEADTLAVPLSQLEGIEIADMPRQAIADWHYWVARGYEY
jgi:hypothetical protein